MRFRLMWVMVVLILSIPYIAQAQTESCRERFQYSTSSVANSEDAILDRNPPNEAVWYPFQDCLFITHNDGLYAVDLSYPQDPMLVAVSQRPVTHVATNPLNGMIAFTTLDGNFVYLIGGYDGGSTLEIVSGVVTDLTFSENGQFLAIASSTIHPEFGFSTEAVITVWDFFNRRISFTLTDTVGAINYLKFNQDGTQLFWAGFDSGYEGKDAGLWDLSDRENPQRGLHLYDLTFNLESPTFEFYPLLVEEVDVNYPIMAIAGLAEYHNFENYYGYDIQVWNISSKEILWDAQIKDSNEVRAGEIITSISLSPDGKYVAVGLSTGVVQIWDIATQKLHWEFQSQDESVSHVRFNQNSHLLYVNGIDDDSQRHFRIWDVTTKTHFADVIGIP